MWGAEEMAKCTERSELLHLLHALAPPRSASLALDEPVCAFDISWEALEISYDKGGEVCCWRGVLRVPPGASFCRNHLISPLADSSSTLHAGIGG